MSEPTKNQQNSNALPNFMSENGKTSYIEENETPNWLANNLHRLMIWVSIIWFGIVLIYISQFFGWSNLFLMMPDEFGAFLAGVTLPLAIIWVVMAYIDRGTNFKNEARFLRAYLNQLVYPEDGGAGTAKAMAEALRAQTVELQQATKEATLQTARIKEELGAHVNDFAKLVGVLDNYSSKTIGELTEGVKTLITSFDYINEKTIAATDEFHKQSAEFVSVSNELHKNAGTLLDNLLPVIKDVKDSAVLLQNIFDDNNAKILRTNEIVVTSSNKLSKDMELVGAMVANQGQKLEQISSHALDSCQSVYKSLENGAAQIDKVLNLQSQTVLNHLSKLEKTAEQVSDRFNAFSESVGMEVDNVIARANGIEESIGIQVRELSGISETIASDMSSVEESIRTEVQQLSKATENAVSDIQSVTGLLEEKIALLGDLSNSTVNKTSAVASEIDDRHNALLQISTELQSALKSLGTEIAEQSDNIRNQTDLALNQFGEVGEMMKKQSENLSEASSIVVSQSKISETALAQQQRHISGSVTKIEEIKGELKRQIDELIKASNIIDEEATGAVKRLKEQMEATLRSSEDVVNRTNALNDNLRSQSQAFENSTSNTLNKAIEFEDILNNQHEKLDSLSASIVERSREISTLLDEHGERINEAVEKSRTTHNELVSSFETQSGILNSVAENTVGYVSDVVQALDEKAETINLLFKHQENEFFDICDRIAENTSNIGSSLKKQVAVIEQSADRVFSRMALLEEDVNKRAETVVASSTKSMDRLGEINDAITKQNQDVENIIQQMADKLDVIYKDFRGNVDRFEGIVKDVRDEATQVSGVLLENCSQIKAANNDLADEGKSISVMMDTHVKNLESALVKVRAQADGIQETFGHQQESLTDVVNVVATQTRLGEASLAQQYKYLSDAANDVALKMNEINAKFKDSTDKVFENAEKIAYEVDVLGDRLLKSGEDIAKSSKSSIKNIEQVNMALSQTADELGDVVTSSTARVSGVMKDYEKYIADFNTITAEASTGVVEISGMINQQSDKMIKISEDTKQLVDAFNTVLNDTSMQLSKRANNAYDKVKGLGENLKELSLQLEEATSMSAKHFENSGDKLRGTIGEIAANAERISNEIRSSGEVFLKQSGVLIAATEDTLKKVNDVMTSLNKNADEFSRRGSEALQSTASFSELYTKQMKLLSDTSAKAEKELKELEKSYHAMKTDTFLKDASAIIEKMETVAVDINRIFNPTVEEEIWKKYYNGDTSAFVRYLAKAMTKNQVLAIRKEFEENLEFRSLVTRYLSDFETLVSKARGNERSGILLSVISGADVGKLYYILAKSLDKLN